MAFRHRKLLNETADVQTTSILCGPYCIILNNQTQICPNICLDICPDVCNTIPIDPPKPHKLSTFLTVSVGVLAAAFFVFTCHALYKFCSTWFDSRRRRRRRSRRSEADDLEGNDHIGEVVDHPIWYIRTVGLLPSVINRITVVKYRKGEDGLIDGTDCAVCLTEFEEDETLRLLPKCNHAFHVPCIDTWLRSHTNCPVCRAGIVDNNAAARLQPQQGTVEDLGARDNREVRMEEQSEETSELRAVGEDDNPGSRAGTGIKTDQIPGGIQALRRSVSMDDSSSVQRVFTGISKASSEQFDQNMDNQTVTGSGALSDGLLISGEAETGSSSIQRSGTCSTNVVLSRHSSRL